MKKYELLTIFKPSLDSEELDKAIDKISSDIKSAKGEVSSVDKMGRKKLAYDLQGYRDGYFTNMIIIQNNKFIGHLSIKHQLIIKIKFIPF